MHESTKVKTFICRKSSKMLFLSLKFVGFLIFLFSVKVYGILDSWKTENVEQPRELLELLFSSPSVLRELRDISLHEDADYNAIEISERDITGRSKRSSEPDMQMAYAVAYSVMESLRHENASDSFNNSKDDFTTKMIRLINNILDCRVDILVPYIKKCASIRLTETGIGKVSCSISSNSSVFCPPCPICETIAILQSPNYPNDYGGPWQCEYRLEAAQGEKFKLMFQEPFIVEKYYDFLMICDDETSNCGNYMHIIDGYSKPKNLYTKYNKVWVKFFADGSNIALPIGKTGRWRIDASTIQLIPEITPAPLFVNCSARPDCGSCSNVTLRSGTIRSSNYPNDNLNFLECEIVIEVLPNAQILLNFTEFVVEEGFDFVVVYDGSYRMLRQELTGYDIPVPFNVKSNKVIIKFKTDGDNWSIPNIGYDNSGRWALDFTVIYPTTTTLIQDNAGNNSTIASYNSTVYPSNLGYTCSAECGVCTNLTPTGGIIQSPNYPADYGNNQYCKILITTSSSISTIVLIFTDFIVEQDYDSISIYDAYSILFKTMSGYTLPERLVLKTTELLIGFSSDENNLGIFSKLQGRWKANFTITPSDHTTSTFTPPSTTVSTTSTTPAAPLPTCQVFADQPGVQQVTVPNLCFNITSSGGVMQSANYPNDYPSGIFYRYHLAAPPGKRIRVTFTTFIVEKDRDNVSMAEDTQYLGDQNLTGYVLPPSVTSVSNKVYFHFLSTTGGNPTIPTNLAPGRWQATFSVV